MALFRFMEFATPANTAADATTYNFALEFEVTEPNIELEGFRCYNVFAAQPQKSMRLYDVDTQTVVVGPVNMPTDQGWVEVVGIGFDLVQGKNYKVQVFFPSNSITYGYTPNVFTSSGITSGPGYAFSNSESTNGQGSYLDAGVGYATKTFNSTNYFVDVVLFKPDVVPGAAVAKVPSQADLNRVFNRIGIPATWPDDLSQTEPAAGSGIVVKTATTSGGSTSGGIVVQPQGNESVTANGSVTSPAADAAIATTAALTGLYRVMIKCIITGTTVATADTDNMDVNVATTSKAVLPVLVTGTTGMVEYTDWHEYYIRFASQACVVRAINVSTASSVYKAFIVATKVAD